VRSLSPDDTTDQRLQSQKGRSQTDAGPEPAVQPPCRPERQRRDDENEADYARQQPMRPFPPEDGLEAVERHVGIERGVLGDLPVEVEFGLPLCEIERRHDPRERLPLGDRQAGFGQPRRAADHHHREHQQRGQEEPRPDRRGPRRILRKSA
jgi:hypothetical protein